MIKFIVTLVHVARVRILFGYCIIPNLALIFQSYLLSMDQRSTPMPPHNSTKLATVESKRCELEEFRTCSIIFQVHEEQAGAMRHDTKKNELSS